MGAPVLTFTDLAALAWLAERREATRLVLIDHAYAVRFADRRN